MKILVCISRTPETTARIDFIENKTKFNTEGVQYIMNPYDEWYALVRAVEIKESGGASVTVINVGDSSNDIIIRKALAIGADDAIRVDAEPGSSYYVANQIAAQCKNRAYDLILLGKETIDYNGAEVGAMLAELLDLPYISFASNLEIVGEKARVTRDIEGGAEVVEIPFPFVLSAAKGLAEQRIPNMRGIMMAKRKPLDVREPVECQDLVNPVKYELPEKKTGVKMVDPVNMEELVRLLHEEAKVI